jgi:hypothetical protein
MARIMRGCDDASQGRAFSIIGPYGTGKSAFGVFLAHWVAANPDARDSLWKQHTLMEQRIVPFESAQLLPIPLLVKATTLRQAIVATLHQHLSHIAPMHPLGGQLLHASENPDLPPEEVATYLGLFTEAVLANTQYHGVMLIIDELGQHLAHIHRSGDSRDLFVLQTIAELAARSGDTPIMVITILHQTFERYSTTATRRIGGPSLFASSAESSENLSIHTKADRERLKSQMPTTKHAPTLIPRWLRHLTLSVTTIYCLKTMPNLCLLTIPV